MFCFANPSCAGAGIVIMAGLRFAANFFGLLMLELANSIGNGAEKHLAMEQEKARAFNLKTREGRSSRVPDTKLRASSQG